MTNCGEKSSSPEGGLDERRGLAGGLRFAVPLHFCRRFGRIDVDRRGRLIVRQLKKHVALKRLHDLPVMRAPGDRSNEDRSGGRHDFLGNDKLNRSATVGVVGGFDLRQRLNDGFGVIDGIDIDLKAFFAHVIVNVKRLLKMSSI